MDTQHADAMVAFEDDVMDACSRANQSGVTDEELASQLRRIAAQLERE